MKVIILAAGIGSRMGTLTKDKPKVLLEINGKTILQRQIEGFLHHGITSFIVVAGHGLTYMKDEIENLKHHYPQITIKIIVNHDYATTQNTYSLWLTKQEALDGFYLIDGDVVAEQRVYDLLCKHEALNALIGTKDLSIEVLIQTDAKNRVLQIGKHIPKEQATFSSVGIHTFSKEAALPLFLAMEELFREKGLKAIYEFAFEKILDRIPVHVVDATGLLWKEIDDQHDYEEARVMFYKL